MITPKYLTRYKKHSGCLIAFSYGYQPGLRHFFSNRRKLRAALALVQISDYQTLETAPHIVIKVPSNIIMDITWLREQCFSTRDVILSPPADTFPK